MFHGLQCTMVNPFEAGSSVLLLFIEIKETICDKAFKRAFNSNGCENYCNLVFKSHSKKLEASSFNIEQGFTA